MAEESKDKEEPAGNSSINEKDVPNDIPILVDANQSTQSQDDPEEKMLSPSALFLLGSAMATVWMSMTMQVCGMGFLLPVIQEQFKTSEGSVQWVNLSFNLTWGCCALVAGRLGDIYGLRKACLGGLIWYMVWLLISGFLSDVIGLSFARALSGIGYAIASPCAAGIIGTHFPQGPPRTLAFASFAGAGAIGAGLGWLLSGIFSSWSRYTWRTLPFVVSALTCYPLIVGYFYIPKDKPHPTDRKVDWLGAVTITGAQLLLALGLTFSITSSKKWKTPYVPVFLVLSFLFLLCFIWQQRRLNSLEGDDKFPPPLLPTRLFVRSDGQLLPLYLAGLMAWAGTDSLAVFTAYLYFNVLDLSGYQAGLRVAPDTFSGLTATIIIGIMLSRIPARAMLIWVNLMGAISGIFFATRTLTTPYYQADLWGFLTAGYATDGIMSVGSILIANLTSREDQGVANAILISFGRMGTVLGLAIQNIIRQAVQQSHENHIRNNKGLSPGATLSDGDEKEAEWAGLQAAFWTCSACLFTSVLIVGFGMRGWEIVGRKKDTRGRQSVNGST